MTQKVSSKLLVLFGIICGTFFFAENCFCEAIQNKSSTFSTQMANNDEFVSDDADSSLAEQIRAQRAAREVRDTSLTVSSNTKSGAKKNSCDTDLRKCIEAKCSADYKKCETDSDTTFSDKLDACKKTTKCTAHEYALFVPEIKEDKKQKIRLSLYNQVINCGNSYNDCIIKECGKKFDKCLSKSAGDKALATCKNIATKCTEADSGMSGRIGSVFATVRQDAEIQIKEDEKKLYTLRDQMRNSCKTLGALFDDRSLDCVFTASFYAGDDQQTPKASKKLYAGSLFDCTPDWFGIDITTFKENAYRLTRAQTAASSAMLGSGVGTAVGALTSGAIGRALDTAKAKDALEDACAEEGKTVKDGKCVEMTEEEKCKADGGKWKKGVCEGKTDKDKPSGDKTKKDDNNTNNPENNQNPESGDSGESEQKQQPSEKSEASTEEQKKNRCETLRAKGTWDSDSKTCKCSGDDKEPDSTNTICVFKSVAALSNAATTDTPTVDANKNSDKVNEDLNKSIDKENANIECKDSGGDGLNKKGECSCSKKKNLTLNKSTNTCECKTDYERQGKECVDVKKQKKEQEKEQEKQQKEKEKEDKQASQKCTKSGGTYTNGSCECDKSKGLMKSIATPGTCNCITPGLRITKGSSQIPALNKNGICSYLYADDVKENKQNCSKYGSSQLTDTGCSCPSSEHYAHQPVRNYKIDGYYSPYGCTCENGYTMENYKCVKKTEANKESNNPDTPSDEQIITAGLRMQAQSYAMSNAFHTTFPVKEDCDIKNKKTCAFIFNNKSEQTGALLCCTYSSVKGNQLYGAECLPIKMLQNMGTKDYKKLNSYTVKDCD